MIDNYKYKIIDYVNINHHNSDEVQTKLNELGMEGFELIKILLIYILNKTLEYLLLFKIIKLT